jgi:hypothetical protein
MRAGDLADMARALAAFVETAERAGMFDEAPSGD